MGLGQTRGRKTQRKLGRKAGAACCATTTEGAAVRPHVAGWVCMEDALIGLRGGYYVGGYYWCGGFVDGAAGGETVGQQATELTAFFQAHIDNLEGHALRTVIAQERGRLQVAHPDLQLQLHGRAGRQGTIDDGGAAGKAGGADFHAAVFPEVDTQGDYGLVEANASVAAPAEELGNFGQFQRPLSQVRP